MDSVQCQSVNLWALTSMIVSVHMHFNLAALSLEICEVD